MPSMKCYNCLKVKQCRMTLTVVPDSVSETYPAGKTTTEYLCSRCARDLGYDEGGEA
jgi:hypothetical protein